MATDHRVRLAHHLISTSIVKQLWCQFSGSLPLYRFGNGSSTLATTLFRRPVPAQIQRISRQIHAGKAYYKFASITSTPPSAFTNIHPDSSRNSHTRPRRHPTAPPVSSPSTAFAAFAAILPPGNKTPTASAWMHESAGRQHPLTGHLCLHSPASL